MEVQNKLGLNNLILVETGVHEVHDDKRVWFEVKLQGAQGDREAEVFQVSNDDTIVAQRRLKDKQPEKKTNMDCLRSTQQCTKSVVGKHLGVAVIQQQNGLVKETNVTLLAKNMCFNESGKYKKTFISSGVGTGSMQVLHRFEFKAKPLGNHTFEVEPQENIDQGAGLQEVQTQDLMDYHLARDREQHLACELFGYREDSNRATFAVAAVEKIYAHESLTFNNKLLATKGLLDKAKENVLGMEIVKDQSGYTLRVSQSRFYNEKLVQTLLEGHSILLLEGSLSGDCDVEKN
nr:zinc finger, CCHC-type [Tanacetum cinerariifolium]